MSQFGAESASQDRHGIVFTAASVRQFWSHWQRHMGEHPAASAGTHVPVGLSGDDTQYSLAGAKLIVLLTSFVLHDPKPSERSRWPYFVLRHELCLGAETLDPILRITAWSLNIAYGGVHPSIGPDGEAFQKGSFRFRQAGKPMRYSIALTECRGDWKFHVELFRLARHYNCNALCMFCNCVKSPGARQFLV